MNIGTKLLEGWEEKNRLEYMKKKRLGEKPLKNGWFLLDVCWLTQHNKKNTAKDQGWQQQSIAHKHRGLPSFRDTSYCGRSFSGAWAFGLIGMQRKQAAKDPLSSKNQSHQWHHVQKNHVCQILSAFLLNMLSLSAIEQILQVFYHLVLLVPTIHRQDQGIYEGGILFVNDLLHKLWCPIFR